MRSPFRYSRQEKRGITFLLFLIATLQGVLWFYKPGKGAHHTPLMKVDSLASVAEHSILTVKGGENEMRFRPFNPNYITDYKGYLLGMSAEELDRLYAFRREGRYVNSAREFLLVTQIPDSLLEVIAPYFSFPEFSGKRSVEREKLKGSPVFRDLNKASAEELQSISGIGPVLSSRIVRFRDRLGGFLLDDQLLDVYGLDQEVGRRVLEVYRVKQVPGIKRISLNTASEEELSDLVYLGRRLASRIVAYRDAHGRFDSIEQLTKIEDFPSERIGRIKLYLAL